MIFEKFIDNLNRAGLVPSFLKSEGMVSASIHRKHTVATSVTHDLLTPSPLQSASAFVLRVSKAHENELGVINVH
jgi:hypothetical protein